MYLTRALRDRPIGSSPFIFFPVVFSGTFYFQILLLCITPDGYFAGTTTYVVHPSGTGMLGLILGA